MLAVLALGVPARAEIILTPFAGTTWGGTTEDNHTTYGGALGFLGGGVFGVEAEFGYVKDFFGEDVGVEAESNRVQSLSGNLVLALPAGTFRPYGTAGISLIRTALEDRTSFFDLDSDNAGYNVGGGLFIWLGGNIGLRGDIRFFQTFGEVETTGGGFPIGKVDFWRGVGGLTLKF
jgi:hypothetical protein